VTFDGKYYQLKDARSEPKPVQKPYPPFVIGGGGEQLTLRVVATYADIWNHGGTVEEFTHKVGVLRKHCAAVGRNPEEITLSWQLRPQMDNLAAAVEDIKRFQEAGASHFVMVLPTPHVEGMATRIAEDVIAKVKAQG
jgi:alkanesulfonate monooxygenase SsuD/methylene tetrahydromethanopterin reductase-like flavin-dependent oxidoreductase (luciferase family)